MDKLNNLIERQKEFQRAVGFPIDSIREADKYEMSEKYLFKMIEEVVELRRTFPSMMNPWSKVQVIPDVERVREEFSDAVLFLLNFAIVWKFSPETILLALESVQDNNFDKLKKKKMAMLNADILKVPDVVSGVGQGNLNPTYVFIGQNPGKRITQGYEFWSNENDGSSKVLLPILDELEVRSECYFTNLVKCTTPENTEPGDEMTDFYMGFLVKELEILKLGNTDIKIVAVGKWVDSKLKEIDHITIHHPASISYGGITKEEYKKHVQEALTSHN